MNIWHDISRSRIHSDDFYAVIEITKGSKMKYELDNSLVRCYPIGVIIMNDNGSCDEKVIAIPFTDPTYNGYKSIKELPSHIFDEMQHFFRVYKELENKPTSVSEVHDADVAKQVVQKSIDEYISKILTQR